MYYTETCAFYIQLSEYSYSEDIFESGAKEDEGKTERLPHFIIIGVKKCGTSRYILFCSVQISPGVNAV